MSEKSAHLATLEIEFHRACLFVGLSEEAAETLLGAAYPCIINYAEDFARACMQLPPRIAERDHEGSRDTTGIRRENEGGA